MIFLNEKTDIWLCSVGQNKHNTHRFGKKMNGDKHKNNPLAFLLAPYKNY